MPLPSSLLYELPPEKQAALGGRTLAPIEMAFRCAEKAVRLRLEQLAHCDAAADEAELLRTFEALDEHFREVFAHLFEPERALRATASALERDKRAVAFVEAGGVDPDGGENQPSEASTSEIGVYNQSGNQKPGNAKAGENCL